MLLNRAWPCYQVFYVFRLFHSILRHFSKIVDFRIKRILGEVTPERVEIVRQADHIFISMIREWDLYDKISQAFAALDTSKAVGVMVSTFSCFQILFQILTSK